MNAQTAADSQKSGAKERINLEQVFQPFRDALSMRGRAQQQVEAEREKIRSLLRQGYVDGSKTLGHPVLDEHFLSRFSIGDNPHQWTVRVEHACKFLNQLEERPGVEVLIVLPYESRDATRRHDSRGELIDMRGGGSLTQYRQILGITNGSNFSLARHDDGHDTMSFPFDKYLMSDTSDPFRPCIIVGRYFVEYEDQPAVWYSMAGMSPQDVADEFRSDNQLTGRQIIIGTAAIDAAAEGPDLATPTKESVAAWRQMLKEA